MSIPVTVELPDQLYQHYEELAQQTQRNLKELLLEKIAEPKPRITIHPRRTEMKREIAAFEAQHQELWSMYPNEFVAIHLGRVIDHDKDEGALVMRIDAKYPDDIVLVRQVMSTLPPDLYIPSLRYVS